MGWVKFASDYEADQKEMQSTADGLESIVSSNPNIDAGTKTAWEAYYKQLTKFNNTPVYDIWYPWIPDPHFIASSGLANTFSDQATQLDGWVATINRAAGTNVPGDLDPTGQQGSAQLAGQLSTVVKWGAIGLVAAAGIYFVKAIKDVV